MEFPAAFTRLLAQSVGPAHAKTVLEVFLSPRFAMLIQGAAPVNFSSVTGYINWQAGLGAKIMLN